MTGGNYEPCKVSIREEGRYFRISVLNTSHREVLFCRYGDYHDGVYNDKTVRIKLPLSQDQLNELSHINVDSALGGIGDWVVLRPDDETSWLMARLVTKNLRKGQTYRVVLRPHTNVPKQVVKLGRQFPSAEVALQIRIE